MISLFFPAERSLAFVLWASIFSYSSRTLGIDGAVTDLTSDSSISPPERIRDLFSGVHSRRAQRQIFV